MKRMLFVAIGSASALLLFVGIRVFHLGPFGIRPGDDIVLAQLGLPDGPHFFVIGHRTKHVLDAYEVTLYKVESDGKTLSYNLAFEDSYWWGCSVRSNQGSGEIEIRADGGLTAQYSPSRDIVISSAYKVPIKPRTADYAELQDLLARSKR